MSTVEIEKDKLRKLAAAIQAHTKAAAKVVDSLAGEQVKKEAMSTLNELESRGVLPELEPHQKEAHADNIRFDRSTGMRLLRKIAEREEELSNRMVTGSIGETVQKEASAGGAQTESDKIWAKLRRRVSNQ